MTSARSPHDSPGYIPWWLLALVAGLFFIAALSLVIFVGLTRPADLPVPTATAVMLTAAPAPTDTPPPPTSPPALPTETIPPPPAGVIQIGAYVQVTGTGDDGFLNLRAEPGLQNPVNYLALEREVLQVQAGPADADGFVWWYLVDPATTTRFGWGVQNYLQVVQGP